LGDPGDQEIQENFYFKGKKSFFKEGMLLQRGNAFSRAIKTSLLIS